MLDVDRSTPVSRHRLSGAVIDRLALPLFSLGVSA